MSDSILRVLGAEDLAAVADDEKLAGLGCEEHGGEALIACWDPRGRRLLLWCRTCARPRVAVKVAP